jgi:coenzyme F420-reducing hydrogenase alpha subunit
MHTTDITIESLTKIEGEASLNVKINDGKVEKVEFIISEYKRFYTEAMKGKPIAALPQLLSRICGTCSNAHIMASIEACEKALGITPSSQTVLLRTLTMYGLMIRDHALHLYLFVMPDLYNKDSFLDFDENIETEHQILHDAFDIKAAGNFLSMLIAGRSVHAPYPTIGGFTHFPDQAGIDGAIKKLEEIRPAVLRLIDIFKNAPWHFDRKTGFMALVPERYGFLNGVIKNSDGEEISEENYASYLERVVLPYSQASAYKHEGDSYMVGALARMNLAKDLLNPKTKETLGALPDLFPSTDIYLNNLAQAIEILHSIDDALDILRTNKFVNEPIVTKPIAAGIGVGVIEAPRGTLYHKVVVGADGIVKDGAIIVPTGQNQLNIEEDIARLVESMINENLKATSVKNFGELKGEIQHEIEKLIRAYDPCISCAAHFLEIKWQ